jgi:hypothetical protein
MSAQNLRRRGTAVVVLMLVMVGVGVAVAAWTSNGVGSGAAKAQTAVTSTIVAGTPVADLFPGKTNGNVIFTVDNPNAYPVTFTSLAAGAVTSGDPTNCPAANVTVNSPVVVNIPVAAGATSAAQTVAGVTNMLLAAPNGCQGVTFTVALTLTGTSN